MQKKPNTKSLYTKWLNIYDINGQARLTYGNRNQNGSYSSNKWIYWKRVKHEGTSWDDGNVLHLDLGVVTFVLTH